MGAALPPVVLSSVLHVYGLMKQLIAARPKHTGKCCEDIQGLVGQSILSPYSSTTFLFFFVAFLEMLSQCLFA